MGTHGWLSTRRGRGQRNAALAQYEIYRSQLAGDLGIEPEPETRALYEHIRDGDLERLGIDRPVQLTPPPAVPSVAPFGSREEELARLDGFLDRALAGQGQVVLVTGSAGSGKTALLREFMVRAMARHGTLVAVVGSCSAQGGIGDPYLPFREMLQMLAVQVEPGRAHSVVSPEHARRLWRLLPAAVQALIEAGPALIGRFARRTAGVARRCLCSGRCYTARQTGKANTPQGRRFTANAAPGRPL